MRLYKFLVGVFVFTLCSNCAFAAESLSKADEKNLSRIERYVYGAEQENGAESRITQLEEDMFGRRTGRKITDKISHMHSFIFKGSQNSPSLDMKLSFLEWRLYNETQEGTLEARLASIDKTVLGSVSLEPLAFRLEQLVNLTIENGLVSLHQVTIPRNTEIKVKLQKEISSRTAKKGEFVPLTLSNDLFIDNNILVMTKGGVVTASVKSVRRAGRFGRTGCVNLDLTSIESMNSTELPIQIDAIAEKYDKRKIGMAAGASTLGYLVLGPIGLAGGAFVKGGEIIVPKGTEITLRTTKDTKVIGVLVNRK